MNHTGFFLPIDRNSHIFKNVYSGQIFFDNNYNLTGRDKLFKIRTVIKILRRKFSLLLYSYKNIYRQKLLLWKGRLSFQQYLPKT